MRPVNSTWNQEPTAATLGAGEFEVVWANPLEGGRVARRVSLEPGESARVAKGLLRVLEETSAPSPRATTSETEVAA